MLGNGARFLGPSAGSTNNINNQHQTQYNRSIWPTATTTFQANGSECKSKILLFILYRIFFVFSLISHLCSTVHDTFHFALPKKIFISLTETKMQQQFNEMLKKVPECLHELQTKHFLHFANANKIYASTLFFFVCVLNMVSMNAFSSTPNSYLCVLRRENFKF
jgi:hypothetical protein